jgi:hypothetical protein
MLKPSLTRFVWGAPYMGLGFAFKEWLYEVAIELYAKVCFGSISLVIGDFLQFPIYKGTEKIQNNKKDQIKSNLYL